MAARFELPPAFWARFADEQWERAPRLLPRPFEAPLLDRDELFEALVCASDQYIADGRTAGLPPERGSRIRVHVGNAVLMTDVERHLPRASDGSLDGYAARMERQLAGRPYEVIVHQLQAYSVALWERTRQFLGGLYAHVGLPAEKAEAVVFLRNHVATSFGLHQDHAGIFMFVLEGRKRLLAWPEEVFRGQEGRFATLDIDAYRDRATVLEGGPGDVVYWPSELWHIGEASGGLSASISLGLRLKHAPIADVVNLAINLLREQRADARLDTYAPQDGTVEHAATRLPPPLERALHGFRAAAAGGELERALRLHWLNRATGGGFTRVPPPAAAAAAAAIADDQLVRGRAAYPIASMPWDDGRCMLSASGHALPAPATPGVRALIERLNTGRVHRAAELVAACVPPGDTGATGEAGFLRRLLDKLRAVRAIELVAAPTTDTHST